MSSPNTVVELPTDILTLVVEELTGENQSLSSLSRTCKALHSLCLPLLLHTVDLSSHNLGRQPQHEDQQFPPMSVVVKADYNNKYRPRNDLVPRQRAFLRLLTSRPELAFYVRELTWTLIWTDFGEAAIADIDRQTWTVFSRLTNVQRLDLASLNDHWKEPYIRQNPDRLFPAVTELRLVGWMHRGLAKAIIDALDVNRFRSLELDCLQDEGALVGGKPISLNVTQDQGPNDNNSGEQCMLTDETVLRQEVGEAIIFPGPMWLPLRILRGKNLTSLASIDINMPPFDPYIDLRMYYTMFQEICKLIIRRMAMY
ncbi:hypothetical protein LTR37_016118 [Vermiconidia calcicola]|uniref:Uncharacterized protein n=1 Tax=Vermiconidia calcicola TaxID=1690605 RepID=A0ACC3MPD6_9PEZI|nr:hypothetical protein LTR37_016118 [Vermiconidia calcicola]